ncbi:hypothetical protein Deima_2659 [Deinococcus maricopensis DSM 21211]|uniref:Uncharacterized protein n=1 Tax=Deinococcus maricopensis (strain DSM 21211 / LMG 22137 / NRRL B-23946 / LB-34) TaxID=709986 RepID=E8UB53_DEIML|nr:hypothetical protein Deima_2659 [Deinococcus maricopensis DSM 21211]
MTPVNVAARAPRWIRHVTQEGTPLVTRPTLDAPRGCYSRQLR